jgi:hypothetical protein
VRMRRGRAGEQGSAAGTGMTDKWDRGEVGANVSNGGAGESGTAWACGR